MSKAKLLVTGGAGYIGSHMCVELIDSGYDVVVLDNLANASRGAITAIEHITQRQIDFIEGDIRDTTTLDELFAAHEIEAVLHFAGLKAVGESVSKPLAYYDNNVHGTLTLLNAMQNAGVKRMVFSSSATVYGIPETMPVTEEQPTSAINPYGQTKLSVEHILTDLCASDPEWRVALLRYFNPVGAHVTGEIGEDPQDIPNNLMPYIAQVAVGRRPHLQVFGNDYPTHDGTGVRDYIHVVDLARGHVAALQHLEHAQGVDTFNLGTGTGYSVLDVVNAFRCASGVEIPYEFAPRRSGDAAAIYADATKAAQILNWRAEYGIERMCADVWRWQSRHPKGYVA